MSTAVATCPKCAARVNVHWKACLVCRTPIDAGAHHDEQAGTVPMPGAHIAWIRQDGTQVRGIVDQVLVEPGAVWVFVSFAGGGWAVLNPRTVKLNVLPDNV